MKKFLLISITFLTSCASYFIRQDCDKINWYQQGQDIAMRGDRISNDEMVNKCRKAEAEIPESKLDQGFKDGMYRYCQPDTVYQTGKAGDLLNMDLCDPGQSSTLHKKHAEGINAYCKDGLNAGLSGKKYKNVCTADLEKTFLPPYKQGRKKYLSSLVQNNDAKLQQLHLEIARLSSEKLMSDSRLATLPYVKAGDADPYAQQRQMLNNQVWNTNNQLNLKNTEKIKIDKENDDYKKELASLD